MREIVPRLAVAAMQMSERPPADWSAPRANAGNPPAPAVSAPSTRSEFTCPSKSTSTAELIAINRGMAATAAGSWVLPTSVNQKDGCSETKR